MCVAQVAVGASLRRLIAEFACNIEPLGNMNSKTRITDSGRTNRKARELCATYSCVISDGFFKIAQQIVSVA